MKKPDEHYLDIAAKYGDGLGKPAVAIADAYGVPRTTAHRWIKEARRRGLLASREATICSLCGFPLGEHRGGVLRERACIELLRAELM